MQAVRSFLEENGFKMLGDGELPVNTKKKSGLFSSTFPVHVAVRQGSAAMLERLLAAGANPEQKDSSGKTPLALAEKLGRRDDLFSEVLQILRRQSACPRQNS